jgi:hypothetical protein
LLPHGLRKQDKTSWGTLATQLKPQEQTKRSEQHEKASSEGRWNESSFLSPHKNCGIGVTFSKSSPHKYNIKKAFILFSLSLYIIREVLPHFEPFSRKTPFKPLVD